jgi:predicted NBD/HSP70 family sugar kinase
VKHTAINREAMKSANQRRILNLINSSPSTRVDLARQTGLTQAAIGIIINKLLSSNIVIEVGKKDDTVMGRKPTYLDINPKWKYVAGISINHEGYEVGIADIKGKIIGDTYTLEYDDNVQRSLDNIANATRMLIDNNGLKTNDIIGMGVVAPGPVDSKAGQILNPPTFSAWHNVKLKEELQHRLPYRIFIDHNSNALARVEHNIGKGKKYNSFALLVINVGIGLGLILNNKTYKGINGLGCEIGHTSVDINGRICACGNKGCLELYASTSAVLYNARQIQKDITSWEVLVDKAYNGDILCNRLLDEQAHYLAHSIINLNNLLELDSVILTGIAAYRGELLIDKIKAHVANRIISRTIRSITIEKSSIENHSLVIAAGYVVINKLFEDDLYQSLIDQETKEGKV